MQPMAPTLLPPTLLPPTLLLLLLLLLQLLLLLLHPLISLAVPSRSRRPPGRRPAPLPSPSSPSQPSVLTAVTTGDGGPPRADDCTTMEDIAELSK